jgi:hypothetical protein
MTAWMVDGFVPEMDTWVHAHRGPRDHLLVPLDGARWGVANYRWTTHGFAAVHQVPLAALHRSVVSRRLAREGAARQRASLRLDESMAKALARRLDPLATHVVVSQNLLPALWARGELGGRTFDVLMTRLPLAGLEAALDAAAEAHPECPTLSDFRAPRALVEAEQAALAAAAHWITPHSAIARMAGPRAVKLDWRLPPAAPARRGRWVVFPASTLGRKGAHEVREAARQLGLAVRVCGPNLEAPGFWDGVTTEPAGANWLDGAAVVVLPAWVEHRPRRLLEAVAAGIPVIASPACGLDGVAGVTAVPAGDLAALRSAIEALGSPVPAV